MAKIRPVSTLQRRTALVARHRLAGDAATPEDVVRALVALHATDPATVYLSVLARSTSASLDDVASAMYSTRTLVRWMAMRRTLFVLAKGDVPMVRAAAGAAVARTLRTQLLNRMSRVGTDPPVDGDMSRWLAAVGDATVDALQRSGPATGIELSSDEPRLRTKIKGRTPDEPTQNLTTSLLTVLGAQGRIVRGDPTGAWTSRQHRWEAVENRWPDGLPFVDELAARRALARRWLERFGPAAIEDLQWWTGWTKTATRHALEGLQLVEVDLDGRPGIMRRGDDVDSQQSSAPVAALLPALDPTPMGWKRRDWFFAIDAREVFDRSGNVGPTVWWDGCVVGSWAIRADGELRTAVPLDLGSDAAAAIDAATRSLHGRLNGALVTPAVRTPLERTIVDNRSH